MPVKRRSSAPRISHLTGHTMNKNPQHPYVIVADGGTDRQTLYDGDGYPSLSLALAECKRLNKRYRHGDTGYDVMVRREDGSLTTVY